MLKSLEGTEMELETTPDTSVPPSRGESQCRVKCHLKNNREKKSYPHPQISLLVKNFFQII